MILIVIWTFHTVTMFFAAMNDTKLISIHNTTVSMLNVPVLVPVHAGIHFHYFTYCNIRLDFGWMVRVHTWGMYLEVKV